MTVLLDIREALGVFFFIVMLGLMVVMAVGAASAVGDMLARRRAARIAAAPQVDRIDTAPGEPMGSHCLNLTQEQRQSMAIYAVNRWGWTLEEFSDGMGRVARALAETSAMSTPTIRAGHGGYAVQMWKTQTGFEGTVQTPASPLPVSCLGNSPRDLAITLLQRCTGVPPSFVDEVLDAADDLEAKVDILADLAELTREP